MHTDLRTCYDNWTTPLAAAELLEIFATRPILDEYRSFITENHDRMRHGHRTVWQNRYSTQRPSSDTKPAPATETGRKDRSLDLTT